MEVGKDFPGIGVCYFCHDGNDNFVMQLRSENCRDGHGTWDIGGGQIEYQETIESALHRELKEEYNGTPINYELLGMREAFGRCNRFHWIMFDYKVLVDPEEIKNNEPHKFTHVDWFKLSKLPGNLYEEVENFLDIYKDKLI